MTWIRRTEPTSHTCAPPTYEPVFYILSASMTPGAQGGSVALAPAPDGNLGDLWRCDDCRRLWRIADACDHCDRTGAQHLGVCTTGRPGGLSG
jgi:hypothetical protein